MNWLFDIVTKVGCFQKNFIKLYKRVIVCNSNKIVNKIFVNELKKKNNNVFIQGNKI